MATRRPAGMLALPLGLVTAIGALVSSAAGAPSPPEAAGDDEARVELEVAGVLPMPEGPAGIVVLRQKGTDVLLPLLVPDGRAVAGRGGGGGGLLAEAIEALGARVAEVELETAAETSAGARVRMRQGERDLEIQAAPSESIALALAASAPIVATRRLLRDEGLTPEDLARVHARRGARDATRL